MHYFENRIFCTDCYVGTDYKGAQETFVEFVCSYIDWFILWCSIISKMIKLHTLNVCNVLYINHILVKLLMFLKKKKINIYGNQFYISMQR